MIDKTTRLRWRRRYRQRRRQVEGIGLQAEDQMERLFFRRLTRLIDVRRFVVSWVLLLVLLIGGVAAQTVALRNHYQELKPAPGGIFSEGIVGSFTNANPLYAAGAVDSAAAHLVFSGLMKYNQQNQLVGDLAKGYSVDESGLLYTVVLRPNVTWHDGEPLTAQDVVFTYHTIQNPDARSPLLTSWQGITIEAKDDSTITFKLPSALSAFPYSMTNGIVPRHLLEGIQASQLRSVRFNTVKPIGSGPFQWETIEVSGDTPETRSEQIGLVPNPNYYAGAPKLQRFILHSYRNEKQMIADFQDQSLDAMSGLDSMPDDLRNKASAHEYNIPLTGQVMVFFKTNQAALADVRVRQALVQSVDQLAVLKGLPFPAIVSRSPLLSSQVGYDKSILQLGFDKAAAAKLLDDAGWKIGAKGIREKGGQPLTFRLFSQSTSEYAYVAQRLQSSWHDIGIDAQPILQSDFEFQDTVALHNYDALLYGISIGLDPDVFAYWHSSQADARSPVRLNFSEYKSANADKALEGGRTRSDPGLRTIKYKPFLEAWRTDAPALALYQPRFLYVTRGQIFNFEPTELNIAAERYSNVNNWMVREVQTTK